MRFREAKCTQRLPDSWWVGFPKACAVSHHHTFSTISWPKAICSFRIHCVLPPRLLRCFGKSAFPCSSSTPAVCKGRGVKAGALSGGVIHKMINRSWGGGWGERSAKGTRPDCQAGLACPVLRAAHCTEASHLKGSLFLHRGGNTYSGESVTVFWLIWRKVSFPNGISVTIL